MKFAPYLILAGLAGSGLIAEKVDRETAAPVTPAGLDAHETNAAASVLGQFRTTTTGWLWLRTDLYLHNGVEMRPLSQEETQAGRKGVGSSDAELGALLNDDSIVTVVPSRDRDFRGIFGELERQTQSYKPMEMHSHNSPVDALPLFRLMTWIDPHFVPGWTAAATIIAGEKTDEAFIQGVTLLEEGLESNPKNISLLNELGRFYAGKKKDFKQAIGYLVQVVTQTPDVRRMDEADLEAFQNAHRWLGLCYREMGRADLQRQVAARGLQYFPDDGVLTRLLGEPPLFLNEEGRREYMDKEIKRIIPQDEEYHEGHDHESGHEGHDHE